MRACPGAGSSWGLGLTAGGAVPTLGEAKGARVAGWVLWLLVACKPAAESGLPVGDSAASAPTDRDTGTPSERCNGEDDDGDGLVDEGYVDGDEDGVADCVDPCVPQLPPGEAVDVDSTCAADPRGKPPPEDAWDLERRWRWEGLASDPEVRHVLSTPLAGDVDADGQVEVLLHAARSHEEAGWMVILDGATAEEEAAWSGTTPLAGLLAADVDADGRFEIVGVGEDLRPTAWGVDGELRWRSDVEVGAAEQLAVADLEGDGLPELLVGSRVLAGDTGALLFELSVDPALPYVAPVAMDLDGDGVQELVVGEQVVEADGRPRFSVELLGTDGHWAAPVQADEDRGAELAMLGEGQLVVVDGDGSELVRSELSLPGVGPPCTGDMDGDGQTEIAWIGGSELVSAELTGEERWGELVRDWSGLAGCVSWDLDADGAQDVIVVDEESLRIFDGPTGSLRFEDLDRASGTVFETVAVADVDADGSGDLLVPGDGLTEAGQAGLSLWSHREAALPGAGPAWLQSGYSVVDVEPDGWVPPAPTPWLDPGCFRGRPSVDGRVPLADLYVRSLNVCFEGCETEAVAVVQVANAGPAASEEDVVVDLWAWEETAGRGELLGSISLGRIAAGQAAPGVGIALDATRIPAGVHAEVRGGGACTEEPSRTWLGSCEP